MSPSVCHFLIKDLLNLFLKRKYSKHKFNLEFLVGLLQNILDGVKVEKDLLAQQVLILDSRYPSCKPFLGNSSLLWVRPSAEDQEAFWGKEFVLDLDSDLSQLPCSSLEFSLESLESPQVIRRWPYRESFQFLLT